MRVDMMRAREAARRRGVPAVGGDQNHLSVPDGIWDLQENGNPMGMREAERLGLGFVYFAAYPQWLGVVPGTMTSVASLFGRVVGSLCPRATLPAPTSEN